MRIALLTYSTKPRGGVVHTLALAEALAAEGAQVAVVTLARGGDAGFFRPVDPAVRLRLIRFDDVPDEPVGARILRSIAILRAGFDPTGFDIVHAQDCISANAADRCVRTVHHLDTFRTPELVACHERAIVCPEALICVSAAVADEVFAGWGRTPAVIPNGVAYDRFAAAAADHAGMAVWRRELGRYILALGGIEPRKGSIDLLTAYAGGPRDRALVFAGGETLFDYRDYRTEFDRGAEELGIRPTILGTVPDDRLPTLIAAAEVLAFCSVKEGFGLAAMEALAAGTPVVARDLPVLREVFADTVDYATTTDEFTAALSAAHPGDPARTARGRELAAQHTWTAAARAHLAFYLRLRPP